jgi:hypothetical protein
VRWKVRLLTSEEICTILVDEEGYTRLADNKFGDLVPCCSADDSLMFSFLSAKPWIYSLWILIEATCVKSIIMDFMRTTFTVSIVK